MKGEIETRLERGIEAAKAGEQARARDILVHVIELDQCNEQAWLWLTAVTDSTADRIVCLENVLFINPDNTLAAAGLQRLRQETWSPSAPAPTLPRLALQSPDGWEEEEGRRGWAGGEKRPEEKKEKWQWARGEKWLKEDEGWQRAEKERLLEVEEEEEGDDEWEAPASAVSPVPTGQTCPHCQYRNPSWVLICDRCGGDLQRVDLREAIGSGAKPRGKSPLTLLAAWGGAFTFNRLLAFRPEIELASWERNLAALVMAVLFASAWRAVTTAVLWLTVGAGRPDRQLVELMLYSAAETLPLILRLILAYVPTALLTWLGALLVGGRQDLKVHAHLTAVAYSAWVNLIALLASLIALAPYLLSGKAQFVPLLEALPTLISVVIGLTGIIWLTQALRTAHRLSVVRAVLAGFLLIALSFALLFGLNLLPNDWLARLVDMLAPSLPPSTD